MHTTNDNQSLTEFEVIGLKTQHDFANGHAYHGLPPAFHFIINDLPHIWKEAMGTSIAEMEERFKKAFGAIIESPVLMAHQHYSLLPTASNSIDIVSAFLKNRNYNVGLIEPVFDNLYLLLKRRQVDMVPIQEDDFLKLDVLEDKIKKNNLKSLFLVSPNNPTGFQLQAHEFRALCDLCATIKVLLILDATFGLYSRRGYDEYRILQETGIDYIVVEDTGKTWPTQEIKVSLMAYSAPLAREMRTLYEEVYLCHSNFSVALLSRLIEKTTEEGIDKIIWHEVDNRRDRLLQALEGTGLSIDKSVWATPLPLAWIDCSAIGLTDLDLVEKLQGSNIAVLPGRFFYWSSPDQCTNRVRISLLRPEGMFDKGLEALNRAMAA